MKELNEPEYVLEKWPLGWVLCGGKRSRPGIPMDALNEVLPLMPKGAVMNAGIAHHLRYGLDRLAVACICTPSNSKKWCSEISESLASSTPQYRWWMGWDVGLSSAAMFAVFCDPQYKSDALEMGRESTPADADDFGRCKRLMDAIPEWRGTLYKVAEAYPNTAWVKIIPRWSEIENASPARQSEILKSI